MPRRRSASPLLPALLGAALLAGCGARSHAPWDEAAVPAGPTEPDAAAPGPDLVDAGAGAPATAPDDGPADDRSLPCTLDGECCHDDDCAAGQVCGDCPGCAGGRQCAWPPTDACPAGVVEAAAPAPNVMFLVDRSESMNNPLERARKWDLATQAIAAVLPAREPYFRFGLTMFPGADGNCGPPEVAVEPDGEQATAVLDTLAASEPLVATPLTDALSAMPDDAALSDPLHPRVVVLVTDGGETCGRDPALAAATLRDAEPAITLYIVGIGDVEELVEVARAAGRGPEVPSGTTVSALTAALEDTLERAAPCRVELGALQGDVSPSLYDGDGRLVPRDDDGHEGWRFAPGREALELHGTACGELRAGAPLSIVWPCGR